MEVAPLPMTDPWSDRIQRDPQIDAQMLRGVPSDIAVNMSMVQIHHHGQNLNFRPYLHLQGRIDEVTPEVKLPYGVEKLPFKEDTGPSFDAFYEFTDEQLAVLVTKGYFTDKFEVPAEMSETTWDLPGTADYLLVYPETAAEPPLVFVGVTDRNEMTMTQASSEYDLHEYFPNVAQELEQATEEILQEAESEASVARSSDLSDLFAEHEFRGPNERHLVNDFTHTASTNGFSGQVQGEHDVPAGVFETLVDQVRSRQSELFGDEAESLLEASDDELTSEDYDAEAVQDEEPEVEAPIPNRPSVRDLYRTRMAPSVAEALAAEGQLLGELTSPQTAESGDAESVTEPRSGEDLFADGIEPDEELDVEPVAHADLDDEDAEDRAAQRRRQGRDRVEAHREAEKAAEERSENETSETEEDELDLS